MIQAGFDEETIVAAVQSKPTDFDTSIEALIELKSAGVSQPVLRAVMDSDAGRPIHPGVPTKTSFPTEIGVYVRDETVFKDVLPEIITWKTGGVMKSLATGGLTKGHTNGVLEGPISRLQASQPLEFVIVATEGTSVVEYQLLKLKRMKSRREFRAITGGILHASSGAQKSLHKFQHEKVAPRTFVVKVSGLENGEYGFLPPGAVGHQSAVSMGKIYTFGLE